MTHLHSSTMRSIALLGCASVAVLLSACGGPTPGYYDSSGNYVQNSSYNKETHEYEPVRSTDSNNPRIDDSSPIHSTTTYDRRGYYDYNGYYVERDEDLNVPQDMFPPRGMCRVWFTDRASANQPRVESCNDIKSRVPAGAYVIYGG